MKLFVQVKAGAKENRVERVDESHFRVSVKALPKEGKANAAILALLGDFLDVPKSRLALLKGETSKNKIISVQA